MINRIYCSNCGKLIAESSKYCRYCGASQHGPKASIYKIDNPALGKTAVKAAEKEVKPDKKPAAPPMPDDPDYIKRSNLCPQVKISFIIGYLQKTSIIPILLVVGLVFEPLIFTASFVLYFITLYVASALAYNHFFYGVNELGFQKEYGVIHQQRVSVPYDKIQNVNISRSLTDRMLGMARINIETAGSASIDDRYIVGGSSSKAEAHLPGVTMPQAKKIHDLVIRNIEN
jgi:membrane protein YdbS with pleckstrin-like domain